MIRYIAQRVIQTIPVLAVVAIFVFLIIRLTPGDPAAVILGPDATTAQVADLREKMGLNAPLITQFVSWIGGIIVGDLGYSPFLQQSVSSAISSHLLPTISLAVFAQLIALIIAIPLGVLAAKRPGGMMDSSLMGATLLGISIPSFLLGMLLALVFGVYLRVLPVAGYSAPENGFFEFLSYLVLPAFALAVMQAALLARMTRSTMIDVLGANYITTAKAKGIGPQIVLYKHALRNAANPILTVAGQTFGVLLTGAVVIETVFNIPGLGQLVVTAIQRRDYEMIQGVVLVATLIYVGINLAVDLLYGVLDPRVRVKG